MTTEQILKSIPVGNVYVVASKLVAGKTWKFQRAGFNTHDCLTTGALMHDHEVERLIHRQQADVTMESGL